MIVIDDEKINSRLNDENNLVNKLGRGKSRDNGKGNFINHNEAGRNLGNTNLDPIMRSIISAAGHIDTAAQVAKNFNVSPSHAHLLKHGRTTALGEAREDIVKPRNKLLGDVRERALDILMASLDIITPEELQKQKIKDVSSIAKDMSHIIEKTNPVNAPSTGPQIVVLTVPQRDIREYNVVNVKATVKENHED